MNFLFYAPTVAVFVLVVLLSIHWGSLGFGVASGLMAGFPLLIGQYFVGKWSCQVSVSIVGIASALYMMGLGYLYIVVFYGATDPLGAVAFFFIGGYSLIVFVPLWLFAGYLDRQHLLRPGDDVDE